jgi:dTDP-4-dehydrorhamnose reductase
VSSFLRHLEGYRDRYHVIPVSFSDENWRIVLKTFDDNSILVHASAITDLEYCAQMPHESWRYNVLNTVDLLELTGNRGHIIYLSSTGLYGDLPLNNRDPAVSPYKVNPSTSHHLQKWAVEAAIMSATTTYSILRVGWLFGPGGRYKNFIWSRVNELIESNKKSEKLLVDNQQFGNPTSVNCIVNAVISALEKKVYGTYNIVSAPRMTRSEYIKIIAGSIGLAHLVQDSSQFVRRFCAPADESVPIDTVRLPRHPSTWASDLSEWSLKAFKEYQ